MHHPWRAFRSLTEWTLLWVSALPGGAQADCDWRTRTIRMRSDLLQVQRRSAIAHEIVHAERGSFPRHLRDREERQVSAEAARRLIDVRDLGEAMAWSEDAAEVADELWIDLTTLRHRLEHLHPSERHYLHRRLEHRREP